MVKSNYHQFCSFAFMTLSDCNNFILFSLFYLAIPRMGIVLVYIQFSIFDERYKKQKEYFHSYILYSYFC